MSKEIESNRRYKFSMKKNMVVFGIGTFFIKIISFIMMPVYSYFLSTESFGVIDIITTTMYFAIPLCTLSISEAILKYGIKENSDLKKVFSTGFVVTLIGIILLTVFVFASSAFIYGEYKYAIFAMYISECVFLFLQSFSKAQSKTITYVISSVIYALFSVLFIVLFIIVKDFGVNGYLFGKVFGEVLGILFLIFACKPYRYFRFKSLDKDFFRTMIKYSAPLAISNISYWLITGSDKYITNYVMGENATGLLSVVHKIPLLCTFLYSIFNYAYVLSAMGQHTLAEKDKNSDNRFYSELFSNLLVVMLLGVFIILLISLPVVLLYASQYSGVWIFIPLYSYGIILGALRGFYTTIYCVKEKTLKVMLIVFSGAVINIVVCYVLMRFTDMGLWAASISTVISNAFIFVYYYFDSKKYLTIRMGFPKFIAMCLALLLCTLPALSLLIWVYYLIISISLIIFVIAFKKEFVILVKKIIPKHFIKNTVNE